MNLSPLKIPNIPKTAVTLADQLEVYQYLQNCVSHTESYLLKDDLERIHNTLTARIHFLEVSQMFGGILDDTCYGGSYYMHLDPFTSLRMFCKESKLKTSALDTGKQPRKGWYLCFQFSTGGLLLHPENMPKTFEEFWQELRALQPAYVGTASREMLFPPEKGKEAYETYKALLVKYREKAQEEAKAVKRKKLEKELASLS